MGEARAEKYKKKGNYGRHFSGYLKKKRGGVCNVTSLPKSVMTVIAATKEKSSSCQGYFYIRHALQLETLSILGMMIFLLTNYYDIFNTVVDLGLHFSYTKL